MKTYNFQKKVIDDDKKIFFIILYVIITLMSCGIFYFMTDLNEFIDRDCAKYYFDNDDYLHEAEEDIISNINKNESIESLFLINDIIGFLKYQNKGFVINICDYKYDRKVNIIRKGKIIVSSILYLI